MLVITIPRVILAIFPQALPSATIHSNHQYYGSGNHYQTPSRMININAQEIHVIPAS
jgi:hypothetical protein